VLSLIYEGVFVNSPRPQGVVLMESGAVSWLPALPFGPPPPPTRPGRGRSCVRGCLGFDREPAAIMREPHPPDPVQSAFHAPPDAKGVARHIIDMIGRRT